MVCFNVMILFPATKRAQEVCTLQVEATVVGNESHLESDVDGGRRIEYSQIVEYHVEEQTIKQTVWNSESEPMPEGTVIMLWVDPENPYNYMKDRDTNGVGIVAMIVPVFFIVFGSLVCVFNVKKSK